MEKKRQWAGQGWPRLKELRSGRLSERADPLILDTHRLGPWSVVRGQKSWDVPGSLVVDFTLPVRCPQQKFKNIKQAIL